MRIWTHYTEWEDYQAGLYSLTCEHEDDLCWQSQQLLSSPNRFLEIMELLALQWPTAYKVNLSDTSQNRQAWLGQAACCFNHGAPDYITKRAWWLLDDSQRIKANDTAQKIIDLYDRGYNAQTLFS